MLHILLEPYRVVLASASPRRKDLLKMLQIPCTIRVSDVAEPITDEDPAVQAMNHARNKALAIAQSSATNDIVVAADTIVVLDNQILGKPENVAMAAKYLSLLSDREHAVITGICICHKGVVYCDHEHSLVQFGELSQAEITEYIASGEPMDKAGAYGIQGLGSQFIRSIKGCYFNVMGFPIHRFSAMISSLKKAGQL